MAMIRLIILTMIMVLPACGKKVETAPEKQRFYDFALAICLGAAFEEEAVKTDFNKAASGIMERSHIALDAYEEIRALVDLQLSKSYESKHGGQMQSLKCFDLRGEAALQKIYEKYDPCRNKNTWDDNDEFAASCGGL